jgi:hypothetical protein
MFVGAKDLKRGLNISPSSLAPLFGDPRTNLELKVGG